MVAFGAARGDEASRTLLVKGISTTPKE